VQQEVGQLNKKINNRKGLLHVFNKAQQDVTKVIILKETVFNGNPAWIDNRSFEVNG
jgi:hypothetical protein